MEYGKPLDSSEDLVKSGIDLYIMEGSFVANFLKSSPNEWTRKIGNAAKYVKNHEEQKELMKRLAIHGDVILVAVDYNYYRNTDKEFADLPPVHESKEIVYNGWVSWAIQKMSPWQEALDLLQLQMKEVPSELEIKDFVCFVSGS